MPFDEKVNPFPIPLQTAAVRPLLDECFHEGRSITQADLYSLKAPAQDWALKDFSARPLWIRMLITRRVVQREVAALSGLEGLRGVPRLAGMLGRDAFIMERLNADRLPHIYDNNLTPEFFARLEALIAEMHARGWAHGDLRRKNILLDAEFNPYLIDFATSMFAGPKSGAPRKWLSERWKRVDNINVARMKASYLPPEDLTERDLELLNHQPLYMRLGRMIRRKLYRPLKSRHRRRIWKKIKRIWMRNKR